MRDLLVAEAFHPRSPLWGTTYEQAINHPERNPHGGYRIGRDRLFGQIASPGARRGSVSQHRPATDLTPEQSAFFETKIRPIFAAKCYKCHSVEAGKSKGGLLLDSKAGWQKGGENGAAVEVGNAVKSRLIVAIGYGDADLQMPPKGEKLSAQEIKALTDWVNMARPTRGGRRGQAQRSDGQARSHWSYQPVKNPPVPAVKDKAWVKTPVDAFILEKLEANKMTPSKAASKEGAASPGILRSDRSSARAGRRGRISQGSLSDRF